MKDDIILSNQVLCLKCEDAPFSSSRHDMRSCTCGNVSVDGGTAYLRRMFGSEEWRDISIEWPRTKYDAVVEQLSPLFDGDDMSLLVDKWIEIENLDIVMHEALTKAATWAKTTRRNMFGLICAMARTERDGDFYT